MMVKVKSRFSPESVAAVFPSRTGSQKALQIYLAKKECAGSY